MLLLQLGGWGTLKDADGGKNPVAFLLLLKISQVSLW